MSIEIKDINKTDNRIIFKTEEENKYHVVFEQNKTNKLKLKYILIPNEQLNPDNFQNIIDSRDECYEYIQKNREEELSMTTLNFTQLVPKRYHTKILEN